MSFLSIDPKFAKWAKARKVAQKAESGVPTRNANPTLKAGPKNNIKPKTQPATSKTSVPKAATKENVARPRGKSRSYPTVKKG